MGKSRKDNHQWSNSDNLLALYYHKYKTEYLGLDEIQVAAMIGTTVASLKMQASNFRRLHTVTEGLSDFSRAQAEIYEKYGELSRYDLFKVLKELTPLDETIANRLAILNYPHRNLRRITN